MTSSPPGRSGFGRARYDGLDLFRPLSVFGVVLIHFPGVMNLGSDAAFGILLRLRDCAFPVIILTSFFVITRSLLANPGRTFAQFAANRFWRLAVPCAFWSAFYWLAWEFAKPVWRGQPTPWPPASLVLSGYGHLWFLEFLFIGSVVSYPFVRGIAQGARVSKGTGWIWAAACVVSALAYWVWGRPFLTAYAASALGEQADESLRVAIGQSIAYAKYPPLGIAAALIAGAIDALYRRSAFRAGSIVVALAACVVHVAALAPAMSRVFYSVAVFVALLRPWPAGVLDWLRPVARLSYAIYLLHPIVTQAVSAALGWRLAAPSVAGLVAGSVVVLAVSGSAAVLLRRLAPVAWLLPIVPVEEGRRRGGMR